MTYHHCRSHERERIFAGLERMESIRCIAAALHRSPGTISREIRRNSDHRGYSPFGATLHASARAMRPRRRRRVEENPWLWRFIMRHLRRRWSPEQIAMVLRRTYPEDVTKHIAPETIYAALYVLPRGRLRKELIACLRQGKRVRKRRSRAFEQRGKLLGTISIRERPRSVDGRKVPGHWEGDLIVGTGHRSAIGTLVERTSRYVLLCPLAGKTAADVEEGFSRHLRRVPVVLRKSLTVDRGSEMARHGELSEAVKIRVFFCDPHSPWQRGTNENTNMLIRDFFPKGTDFSTVSHRDLRRVALLLNTRPRKTLHWKTPLEVFTSSSRVALGS